ncbi:MAG: protein phosphatase 2C domain-containing protein [Coriobacteriia bacterium]
MELGGVSVPGPRPYNEDTYLLKDLSAYESQLGGLKAFIMVSDGMGGHESGDVASRLARESAEAYVDDLVSLATQKPLAIEPAIALTEIVAEAHQAVVNAAAAAGGSSMGATFIGAFVSENRAWIGHVGDSRAYLLHRGEGRQLTVDHSAVGRMISEGVLTEEQAQTHPQRNVIEKALGFEGSDAEVDIVDFDFGDVLVLCSDGLSTVLSGIDIAEIAAAAPDAQAAAASLADEAIKAESDDNTTAVIWCDDWALFQRSSPLGQPSRRRVSPAVRAASRHRRAQSSSLWIAAGLGVAAVLLIGFMALSPKPGGGASGPSTGSVSSSLGTRPKPSAPDAAAQGPGVDKKTDPPQAEFPGLVVPKDVPDGGLKLREEPANHVLAVFQPGATVTAMRRVDEKGDGAPKGKYYEFRLEDIKPEQVHATDSNEPLSESEWPPPQIEFGYALVSSFRP